MVEWLKESGNTPHQRPECNMGGSRFHKRKSGAVKKKLKYSKIDAAIEQLKKVILSEMNDLVEKHKEALAHRDEV